MAKASKEPKIKWSEALLQMTFNLNASYTGHPLLEEWLDVENNLLDSEKTILEGLSQELAKNVAFWNEEELKVFFLAFIIKMADYHNQKNYRPFLDREISGIVEGTKLTTKADLMISKGLGDVYSAPYFCFHEFKRKKNADDPVAQVLVAMLIAQEQNKNDKPIYGCYVMGSAWYFMVMQGKTYCETTVPFTATDPNQLQKILLILRKFKVILETQLQD
jgi:hypothetical protein